MENKSYRVNVRLKPLAKKIIDEQEGNSISEKLNLLLLRLNDNNGRFCKDASIKAKDVLLDLERIEKIVSLLKIRIQGISGAQ